MFHGIEATKDNCLLSVSYCSGSEAHFEAYGTIVEARHQFAIVVEVEGSENCSGAVNDISHWDDGSAACAHGSATSLSHHHWEGFIWSWSFCEYFKVDLAWTSAITHSACIEGFSYGSPWGTIWSMDYYVEGVIAAFYWEPFKVPEDFSGVSESVHGGAFWAANTSILIGLVANFQQTFFHTWALYWVWEHHMNCWCNILGGAAVKARPRLNDVVVIGSERCISGWSWVWSRSNASAGRWSSEFPRLFPCLNWIASRFPGWLRA